MPKYHRQFGIPFSRIYADKDLPYLVPIRSRLVLGIVGLKLSGKTKLSSSLVEEHGFKFYSLSQVVRDLAMAKAVPLTPRRVLQDFGDELRLKHGRDFLARETVKKIYRDVVERQEPATEIVIGGIKNLGEVVALKHLPNFFLVCVKASTEARRSRAIRDGLFSGTLSEWEEEWDARDVQTANDFGQQVGLCMAEADETIINDGSPTALVNVCEKLLRNLRERVRKGTTP